MPAGQPTKYKPEYCDKIIEMGNQGLTKAHMAMELGVHRDTIHEWTKVHPAFSDAMKKAEEGIVANLTKIFIDQATGTGDFAKGNATAAIFLAKNMAPHVFRDRHEHEVRAEVGIFEISYEGANYGDVSQDTE